jgi:hypothetical protein
MTGERDRPTWSVTEEHDAATPYDLALVLVNVALEGTDRDVRLVVTWAEADDEPEVLAVYPCRECGWRQSCKGGEECHS